MFFLCFAVVWFGRGVEGMEKILHPHLEFNKIIIHLKSQSIKEYIFINNFHDICKAYTIRKKTKKKSPVLYSLWRNENLSWGSVKETTLFLFEKLNITEFLEVLEYKESETINLIQFIYNSLSNTKDKGKKDKGKKDKGKDEANEFIKEIIQIAISKKKDIFGNNLQSYFGEPYNTTFPVLSTWINDAQKTTPIITVVQPQLSPTASKNDSLQENVLKSAIKKRILQKVMLPPKIN
jgi:hypothetical protein